MNFVMTDVVLSLPLLSNAALANAASLQAAIQSAPANADTATALEVLASSDGLKNLQTGWLSSETPRSMLARPIGTYGARTRYAFADGETSAQDERVRLAPPDSGNVVETAMGGWDKAKALNAIRIFEQFLQNHISYCREMATRGIPLSDYALAQLSLLTSLLPVIKTIYEKINEVRVLEARILFEEIVLRRGVNLVNSDYPTIRLALRVEWNQLEFEKLMELATHLLSILQEEIPKTFTEERLGKCDEEDRESLMRSERKLTILVRKAGEVMSQLPPLVAQEKFREAHDLLERDIVQPIRKKLSRETAGESATAGIEEIFMGMLEGLSRQIPAVNNVALLAQECLEMARRDLSHPKAVKECEELNEVARLVALGDPQKAEAIVRKIIKHAKKEQADNVASKLEELLHEVCS